VFTLIWSNRALDQLAEIYVSADAAERARMAPAIEALNVRLRNDPSAEGESRAGELRITFIPLLAVAFYVSQSDRVVRVGRVRRFGK
jgi:hypothetical protein